MPDFSTPFGTGAERREPTGDEINLGFPCGPADQLLFNWLFWSIMDEIGQVQSFSGITLNDNANDNLRRAIEAMIASATGGGDTSQFLLMSQARARLPFYPDVQNVDGKIGLSTPGGNVIRVAGGVNVQHRGIFPFATVQTDLPHDASKTYHVRCNMSDGSFSLKDLSAPAYNPGALAETDASFDSTYDDMLIGRVVTNAGNVATVTELANMARLNKFGTETTGSGIVAGGAPGYNYTKTFTMALNWARTPRIVAPVGDIRTTLVNAPSKGVQGGANILTYTFTRYGTSVVIVTDFDASQPGVVADYQISVGA